MKTRMILMAAVLAATATVGSRAQAQFAAPGMDPAAGMMPMAPVVSPMMMGMSQSPMYFAPGGYPVQPAAFGGEAYAHGGACDQGCSKCQDGCCPGGGWCHRLSFFADFLYLRARDSEVAYAVEVNSVVAPPAVPVQVGPVGVADHDYEPSWRAGVTYVLDTYSSITAQYTMFEGDTYSRTDRTSGIIGSEVVGLVFHPGTAEASDGGIFSDARYNISYDAIDFDYRELISYDCFHETNFLLGTRYVELEQRLNMQLPINGNETVATDIDFYGAGARMGLESVRYSRRGLFGYGKGHGSLLVGEFRADYDQGDTFDASVVDTAWRAGRMVPVLDLELGLGWTSSNGYWRFSAGYLYSAWFNVVKTDEFIDAVQANNFTGLSDTMTFDGFVARVESRF
jgi:hypothetical protein